jgi:hypothetical protein
VSRRRKLAYALVVVGFVGGLAYAVRAGLHARQFYGFVKAGRVWEGRLHQPDARLGYAPVPGGRGQEVRWNGPPVPVAFDADGFRVVPGEEGKPEESRGRLLAIGCSFTFGLGCRAEEAWPHRAAASLGLRPSNAGVSGYGLASMLLRARDLVPRHSPAMLVVQYSPWLVARSQSPFAPSRFGQVPVPWFRTGGGEDRLETAPPPFTTLTFSLPVAEYRTTPNDLRDFASFFFSVGLPLRMHDDAHLAGYHLARLLGRAPEPEPDRARILRLCYAEIAALGRAAGATVAVVHLGSGVAYEAEEFRTLGSIEGLVLVDAQRALWERLPEATSEAYGRTWHHWEGERLLDLHPNPAAHAVVAEEVARALRR